MNERKPLAALGSESRGQSMTVHPTRWPEVIWAQFEARARAQQVSVYDVVRECGTPGGR